MSRFDAVLLASFGGPNGPQDVMPFLQAVTAGRGVPPERLKVVATQYEHFGGVSPINRQNIQLAADLEVALGAGGDGVRVYVGNRNWDPYFTGALRQMVDDQVQRAAVVVTSGYSSYSGCRQYRENLFDARREVMAEVGTVPELVRIGRWFDQPEFVEVMADNVAQAVAGLAAPEPPTILFTTHSLPMTMAATSGDPESGGNAYVAQHTFVAERVMQRFARAGGFRASEISWELVYQSRSGSPRTPWLEPDVGDRIGQLARAGVSSVVIVPIGFMSDHMEVMWDLDTLAMRQAADCGVEAVRAATVGTDPRFVAALVRMIREREEQLPRDQRCSLWPTGAAPDRCPVGCCPNPSGNRPALFGEDQ